jgi:hypothetical protein
MKLCVSLRNNEIKGSRKNTLLSGPWARGPVIHPTPGVLRNTTERRLIATKLCVLARGHG